MPISRKANDPQTQNCSFCNAHKDEVPLMITSMQTKALICSWCALGVVNQTFKSMDKLKTAVLLMDERLAQYKKQYGELPKIQIAAAGHKPDPLDAAVGRALNANKGT